MPKLIIISGVVLLLAFAPRYADSVRLNDDILSADSFNLEICTADREVESKVYAPTVISDTWSRMGFKCMTSDGHADIVVNIFAYKRQSVDNEAVNSKHRFVSKVDLQRFGQQTVDTAIGPVNEFRFESGGKRGLTWQWYLIPPRVYSSPSRVKLAELMAAIRISPTAPTVFVLQGFAEHQQSDQQTLEKNLRQTLALVAKEIVHARP